MRNYILFAVCLTLSGSCNDKESKSSVAEVIDLKRGPVISCGPQEGEIFGSVSFNATVAPAFQKDFNTALVLLLTQLL